MTKYPKVVTFNVNGIRDSKKRRLIFNHLHHIKADIVMLQETHSSVKDEKIWKAEWGGQMLLNHGTTAARGVAILIKKKFPIKILRTAKDNDGRVLAVAVLISGFEYVLSSIYAPNDDVPEFFVEAFRLVESLNIDLRIITGDFNTVLDLECDLSGGRGCSNAKTREFLKEYMSQNDLVDVWRELHPGIFRSTFIRRNPVLLMERLDYILTSRVLLQNTITAEIPPAYKSDHATPFIEISFAMARPGRGCWKLNTSLLEDEKLNAEIIDIFREVFYKTPKAQICEAWEMVKLKIRGKAIQRGIQIAKSDRLQEQVLQRTLERLVKQRDEQTEVSRVLFDDFDVRILEVQDELSVIANKRLAGAMIRCKANWLEQAELPTKYFLALEKHNHNQKLINRLQNPVTHLLTSDPNEILEILNNYYRKLYQEKQIEIDPDYLALLDIPQVKEKDKQMLDAPIQLEEIHVAMKQLNLCKVPGTDGFPVEFYRKYWDWIAKPLHLLFLKNVENGFLHGTARDGIISLLSKPGDLLLVPNWRPITLLNTDYKLFTKVLANRLQQVLTYLINHDQSGYIKGRLISDNTLDLLTLIQYCDEHKIPALAVSVDFHKMFDTVQFKSITEILRAFNFGDRFIHMIQMCQRQMRSAVINNGQWSDWINIQAGVRQGDPCAGLIAILVLEIIALKIRQNDNIKGIHIGSKTKKLDQYVDDLWNVILAEKESFDELLYEYSEFQDFSGLAINYNKTEVLRLGSLCHTDAKFYSTLPLKWSDGPVKVLGMQMYGQSVDIANNNYNELLTKIDNILKNWSTRMLTPIGKICIVNTLINSQVTYKLQSLPTPSKQFFDKYKKLISQFIWDNKKANVSYVRLIASKPNGGLQLRDLVLTDMSLKMAKIHDILKTNEPPFWMQYFAEFFHIPVIDIFQSNFSERHVKKFMPPSVFRDMCYYWAQFNYSSPEGVNQILQERIWYNSRVLIQGKWLFEQRLYNAQINKIIDLFDLDTGAFMSFDEFNQLHPNVIDFITYYAIIDAIPKSWKQELKNNLPSPPAGKSWLQKFQEIKIKPSRFTYKFVRDSAPVSNERIKGKWEALLTKTLDIKEFNKNFVRLQKITRSSKLRYFQYRLLTFVLTTNLHVAKWDRNQSQLCSFCGQVDEDYVHLFVKCSKVQKLWEAIRKWWNHFNHIKIALTSENIVFSNYAGRYQKLVNIYTLVTKFYIYRTKVQGKQLKFVDLMVDINQYKNLELIIAKKKDALYRFARKWDDFSVFSPR